MRPLLVFPVLLVMLASPSRSEGDARDPLRDAEMRRLVWAAADAAEEDAGAALAELRSFPGASWREVRDVLAAGRDYGAAAPPLDAPTEELDALARLLRDVPWRRGETQVLDLGATPQRWYRIRAAGDYDGSRPFPVLLDLGGIAPLQEGEAPPDGWLVVTLNDLLFHVPDLGGVPLNLTAGTASQTIVRSVVADLERRVNVDRDRVFIGGYSRGGNAALYFAAHWPDLWAGAIAASGYYPVERDTWPNLRHVALLAARGSDRGHRGANAFMARLGDVLRSMRHPDVSEHVADGRAVDDGLRERAFTWMGARHRDPLPDTLEYTWRDPRHRGAYWIELLEPKSTGGTRPVVIGAPGDPVAERFPVHRRASWVKVERTGRRDVTVRSKNVRRLRLLLSADRFDLSAPLRVHTSSGVREIDVTPTIRTLIEHFREDRDRRRLFPATVDLTLR